MNLSIKTSYTNEMTTEESIFSNKQLGFIDEIRLPKVIRFIRADKFDDKFLNPSKVFGNLNILEIVKKFHLKI